MFSDMLLCAILPMQSLSVFMSYIGLAVFATNARQIDRSGFLWITEFKKHCDDYFLSQSTTEISHLTIFQLGSIE
jgi:hypothetical protein